MPDTTGPRRRAHLLQLAGPVAALSEITLLSQHLTFPYTIDKIALHFPLGTDSAVRVSILVCLDESVSTAGEPPGNNIISAASPRSYIVGEDVILDLDPDFPVPHRGTWVKAHLVNTDAFPHTITIIITLTVLLEETP